MSKSLHSSADNILTQCTSWGVEHLPQEPSFPTNDQTSQAAHSDCSGTGQHVLFICYVVNSSCRWGNFLVSYKELSVLGCLFQLRLLCFISQRLLKVYNFEGIKNAVTCKGYYHHKHNTLKIKNYMRMTHFHLNH